MAWMVLLARVLDRHVSWPNLLAAAVLLMLSLDPMQLFDPGFQLSFGAVASLMAFTPRWTEWLTPRLGWVRPGPAIGPPDALLRRAKHGGAPSRMSAPPGGQDVRPTRGVVQGATVLPVGLHRLRHYAAMSLGATSAVWVGLWPLLAWYFSLVSPVSLLANLCLAPLVSALIVVGTLMLMIGTVWEAAVMGAQGLVEGLLHATLWCVRWCDAIPGGSWATAKPAMGVLLGYYGLLGLSLLRRRLGLRVGRVLVCWAVGLMVFSWSAVAARAMASRWLSVVVLDVGHGDSAVIRTPSGRAIVVDAGTQEAGRFRVLPFLKAQGIGTVDALILTHADDDHVGGAVPLLEALHVKRVLTNGGWWDTGSMRRIRELARARAIPLTALAEGMRVEGDPGVTMTVLHPPPEGVPGAARGSNDQSVVLKVTRGEVSVLLTGDLEEGGLPWLLRQGDALRSTVLKVPHHGSRLGAMGERLFQLVRPALAIVSVGRLHHLPAQDTLDALQRAGAAVSLTRETGTVFLRTDGRRLYMRAFRFGNRNRLVGSSAPSTADERIADELTADEH
jgi:competence protein ComEC